jgi:hypothetical protein
MSAIIATLETEGEIALVAATAKTILQLVAPANHRLKIIGWGVFFDGTNPNAEPVQVRLLRQTTAGTATAVTPKKNDNSISETIQSAGQKNATAEPTAGDVLKALEVHPQGGYEEQLPFGLEYIMGGSGRLGIECNAPAGVNVRGFIRFEE